MRLAATIAALLALCCYAQSQTNDRPTDAQSAAMLATESEPSASGISGVVRLPGYDKQLAELQARLDQLEPTGDVNEWLRSINEGRPRVLAPGWYVIKEPIKHYRRHGLCYRGSATGLMDPVGTGRAWWRDNPSTQCVVVFDLPEGVPGIEQSGCQDFRFSGVNFCRTTPGPIITDSNAKGANSGGHVFEDGSFFRRWRHPSALPDPLSGLGINDDAGDYIGLGVYGGNGCDNFTFRRWRFENLYRGVDVDCPQTTRLALDGCWWERCDYMVWAKRSGNLLFTNCTRYGSGPIVLESCPNALTSVTWLGSWLDASAGAVKTEGMAPLVDFSRNPTGRLTLTGGNGRKCEGAPNRPLVIPPRDQSKLTIHNAGAWSAGQALVGE